MSADDGRPFTRPSLARTGPKRGASHLYRSAADGGEAVGGIPLDSVESTVVAAVRMGYRIAAAQIDRTERLGRRLRQAGDQAAGAGSDKQALDAAEELVFNAAMAGLSWVEGFASQSDNPLKRLVTAQYRMLGALLGLTSFETAVPPAGGKGASTPRREGDAGRSQHAVTFRSKPANRFLRIVHQSKTRRAVLVSTWHLESGAAAGMYAVTFYGVHSARSTIAARLIVSRRGEATLELQTPAAAKPGRWKGAVCDDRGAQVGCIEIEM